MAEPGDRADRFIDFFMRVSPLLMFICAGLIWLSGDTAARSVAGVFAFLGFMFLTTSTSRKRRPVARVEQEPPPAVTDVGIRQAITNSSLYTPEQKELLLAQLDEVDNRRELEQLLAGRLPVGDEPQDEATRARTISEAFRALHKPVDLSKRDPEGT